MIVRDDCIFCRIGRGEVAADIVCEDESVVAFHDNAPQSPVHVLVIPREHFMNLQDAVPDEILAALFRAVREVAVLTGIGESGYRVIVNNGPDANQTVEHLHVHVMGGRAMSHGMVNFSD